MRTVDSTNHRSFGRGTRRLRLEFLEQRRLLAAEVVSGARFFSPAPTELPVFDSQNAAVRTTPVIQFDVSSETAEDHEEHIEDEFPVAGDQDDAGEIAGAPLVNEDTFSLHSRPGSNYTIYLDFDGGVTEGTGWNNSSGIETLVDIAYTRDSNSASFSDSELQQIRNIWKLVAEDFSPFDVNVTTEDPGEDALRKSGSSDTTWGIRSLHTSNTNKVCGGCGGVAYIGSFTSSIDLPAYSFNKGVGAGGNTQSHEVGHSLRLGHDGIAGGATYYNGHGSGDTSWGPIMGGPSSRDLKTWSSGEYYNASNQQDDLDRISTLNGFSYRPDDHGNAIATATHLTSSAGGSLSGSGVIERSNDIDFFAFTTEAGLVSFEIEPFVANPNLDVWAGIYDSAGSLVAESNPFDQVTASFDEVDLASGNYYLRVEGVGSHGHYNGQLDRVFDPGESDYTGSEIEPPWAVSSPTGYSDYASVGQYWITGSRVAATSDILAISAVDASRKEGQSGTTEFSFLLSRTGDTDQEVEVTYAVLPSVPDSDSTLAPHTVDGDDFANGVLPTGTVTIPVGEEEQGFVINVAGDTDFERDETFRIVIFDPSTGWSISDSAASATIESDETSVGIASLNTAHAVQNEGDPQDPASYSFTLVRMGDTSVENTVQWEVDYAGFDSPANDSDFANGIRPVGSVVFEPGISELDITIELAGDLDVEGDESFRVAVTDVAGSNQGIVDPRIPSRRGIILEDESPVTVLDQVQFRWRQIRHGGTTRDPWAIDNVTLTTTSFEDDFDPALDQTQWDSIVNGSVNFNSSKFPGGNGQELLMEGTGDRIATSIAVQPGEGASLRFDLIIGNGTGSGGNGADNAESGKDVWLEYSVDGEHWDLLKKMDTNDYESWNSVSVEVPDRTIVPNATMTESDQGVQSMPFRVVRSGNLAKSVSVDWQLIPSGTDPIDADDLDSAGFPSGTIDFDSDEDFKTINIPVLGDLLNEADEQFQVLITSSSGGPVTGGARIGRVLNDDEPSVDSVTIEGGTSQRSSIRELTIQFEGLVDLAEGAFALRNLGTVSAPIDEPVGFLVEDLPSENGNSRVAIRFPGGVSLPNGSYRLDIDQAKVTSRAGGWAMSNPYSFGSDVADQFFRKYGDMNGNGVVDLVDFASFRSTYGLRSSDSGFHDELDSDHDGLIGLIDFAEFRRGFGS
ncbi:MAG: Calx-beta domain-containing protein [Rubripirellula sp.]